VFSTLKNLRQDELIGDKVTLTLILTYGRILSRPSEEQEVGVRWPPACEDVNPGAEERPLLEDFTKQRSEDRD
jgi:hypothetical protein